MPENNELSDRELEILELVATGASNKEIANELYISSNTVKVHLRNIFTKIGANSRTEAAMYALKEGLIESPAVGEDGGVIQQELHEGITTEVGSPWLVYGRWIGLVGLIVIILVGAVVISRGQSGDGSEQIEQVTPEISDRWEEKSMGVVAYENRVYAIAGSSNQGASGLVERYEPQGDRWTALASKPTEVTDIGAAATGGKIFIPGGLTATGELSSNLEAYDIQDDRWEELASMPVGVSAYALTAFEGRLYLFGGWDGQSFLNTVYEYDPSSDVWQEKTTMPTARGFAGAVVAGGRIFVIGGFNGERALSVNEVYMPNRDNGDEDPWEQATPLPEGRYAMGVVSVSDIIHIVGGRGNEDERLDPIGYFPQQDFWQPFDIPISHKWSRMGGAAIGGEFYVLGGEMDDSITDQFLAYRAIYTVSIPNVVK